MNDDANSQWGEWVTIVGNSRTWPSPTQEKLNEREKQRGEPVESVEATIERVLDGYPLIRVLAGQDVLECPQ